MMFHAATIGQLQLAFKIKPVYHPYVSLSSLFVKRFLTSLHKYIVSNL